MSFTRESRVLNTETGLVLHGLNNSIIDRMNTNSTILIKRSLIERVVLCNLNNAYFLIHVVFAYQKPVFNDFLGFNDLPVNIGFCEDKTQL